MNTGFLKVGKRFVRTDISKLPSVRGRKSRRRALAISVFPHPLSLHA